MDIALNYFYEIFAKCLSFVFETCNFSGVSVGWICVSVCVIVLLVRSILNVPRSIRLKQVRKESNL